ncbi:MAG: hypothetical protein P1U46_04220 [Patescibacteria group bacterium]|nr:hypothetical protein [Patescibacteria group bacterium]
MAKKIKSIKSSFLATFYLSSSVFNQSGTFIPSSQSSTSLALLLDSTFFSFSGEIGSFFTSSFLGVVVFLGIIFAFG